MKWYKKGTISMFYTYATIHKEDVRAVMNTPSGGNDEKVDAYGETPEGTIVAKGSLSVGSPSEPNYVASFPASNSRREEFKILENLEIGVQCPIHNEAFVAEGGGSREYENIVTFPAWMCGCLNAGFPPKTIKQAVGFFGATEIRLINGPIRTNSKYRCSGTVVCIGASPRIEFACVDSQLIDKQSGVVMAEMRHMTRWMKASSDLWK